MELLGTAVVDITTLVATSHALQAEQPGGDELPPKLRRRLRRDLKRGTLAYIDVLARSRQGTVDDALLDQCRVAAEQAMAQALGHRDALNRVVATEPGALEGLAAARQDLWHLAHLALHLGAGLSGLRAAQFVPGAKSADALGRRLRRRFRKALVAYARASLRAKSSAGKSIVKARYAALAEIGPKGAAEAKRLADIEAGASPARQLIREGVTRRLLDLALDWHHRDAAAG